MSIDSSTEINLQFQNSKKTSTLNVRENPTRPQKQRAGPSVEERPLILNKRLSYEASLNKESKSKQSSKNSNNQTEFNLTNFSLKKSNGKKFKDENPRPSSSENNKKCDGGQNSEVSVFMSSLLACRNSTLLFVETIRERFSFFRRSQILSSEANSNKQASSCDHEIKQSTDNKLISKADTSQDQRCVGKNVADNTSLCQKQKALECQEDDIKQKHRRRISIKEEEECNKLDELHLLGETTSQTLKETHNDKYEHHTSTVVNENQTQNYSKPKSSSCVDSTDNSCNALEISIKPNSDFENNKKTDGSDVLTLTLPKIIHRQPLNNESDQLDDRITFSDTIVTSNHTEDKCLPTINSCCSNSTPAVKLYDHAAPDEDQDITSSTRCPLGLYVPNINQNNHSQTTDPDVETELNDKSAENVNLLLNSSNVDEEGDKNGLNMWDLRNSLEKITITHHYGDCDYDYINDSFNQYRSFSITTTDGMTEISPLSTPSSGPQNSNEKSMSDTEDDESRAFIITPSGRLSPRLPSFRRRRNSEILSTAEQNCDKAPVLLESNRSAKKEKTQIEKNVFVTQATLENISRQFSCNEENSIPSIENCSAENGHAVSPQISTCHQRRHHFMTSQKWSTVDNCEESEETESRLPSVIKQSPNASKRVVLTKQMSLPLTIEHKQKTEYICPSKNEASRQHSIIRFIDEDHAIARNKLPRKMDTSKSPSRDWRSENSYRKTNDLSQNRKQTCLRVDSTSSDDVFFSDSICDSSGSSQSYVSRQTDTMKKGMSRHRSCSIPSNQSDCILKSSYNNAISRRGDLLEISHDSKSATTAQNKRQKSKCKTRPRSSNSSMTTSPSPTNQPHHILHCTKSLDLDSNDSSSSQTSSSKSSSSIKSISKFFRRSIKHTQQRSDSAPTFCGYSVSRDYCMDVETDRIFKEFLGLASPSTAAIPNLPGEKPPPPDVARPRPLARASPTNQLRRQVMKKQYSDSVALYYSQCQRRWRYSKQKSDSINCPIERAVFRRQDRIEEEFDPNEIYEIMSSTSSRRNSIKPDYILPTVNELREWRRSSEDRPLKLRQANSLPSHGTYQDGGGSSSATTSAPRVRFQQPSGEKQRSHSQID